MDDLGLDGFIILQWIFQEVGWVMDRIYLTQDRKRWRAVFSSAMNLRVTQIEGNFLTRWGPVNFSKRTLLHEILVLLTWSPHRSADGRKSLSRKAVLYPSQSSNSQNTAAATGRKFFPLLTVWDNKIEFLLSQNTTILGCYLYLSWWHVSALAPGHLHVTRYITEETIQCES